MALLLRLALACLVLVGLGAHPLFPPPATASPPLPTATPTATPVPTTELIPLADQRAVMLAETAADLERANAWDRYRITATLDPKALTITGNLAVAVRNRTGAALEALYFHLYPNHPDFSGSLTVEDVRANGQAVRTTREQGAVLLRVALAQPLAQQATVTLTLRFTAKTPRNASADAYGAFNQEAGVWALTNFYPILARYFPGSGWDRRVVNSRGDFVVSEVALYDVTLDAPTAWALVTTGVQVDTPQTKPAPKAGMRRVRYVSGPQREFFVAALNGLDQVSAIVEGTRIVASYQRGNVTAGKRSLEVASNALRAFNARYGRYPFAELEVVQAALTSFLGVEYPGIVLIEQNLYHRMGSDLETTIAHEVAHQWWYSQVGNDFQGEPWLDESMASFSQIVYYEFLGDTQLADQELATFRQSYITARDAGRDGAINRHVAEYSRNYYALVYAKGSLFFQALRNKLGEATFNRFLQRYYYDNRYREVTGADLLTTAEASCTCDLASFYAAWVTNAAAVTVP